MISYTMPSGDCIFGYLISDLAAELVLVCFLLNKILYSSGNSDCIQVWFVQLDIELTTDLETFVNLLICSEDKLVSTK